MSIVPGFWTPARCMSHLQVALIVVTMALPGWHLRGWASARGYSEADAILQTLWPPLGDLGSRGNLAPLGGSGSRGRFGSRGRDLAPVGESGSHWGNLVAVGDLVPPAGGFSLSGNRGDSY